MGKKRYNLADFKERKREAGVEVELSDGSTILIPPPELWPDGTEQLDDAAVMAKAIVGDEAFVRFTADGGTGLLLMGIVKDSQGGTDPGESPASSDS